MDQERKSFLQRLNSWQTLIVGVIAAAATITGALIELVHQPSPTTSSSTSSVKIFPEVPSPTEAAIYRAQSAPSAVASSPVPQSPPIASSSSQSQGRWVAMLGSIPTSDGTAKRDADLQQIQSTIPEAQWLSSNDYASLAPDFWVLYVDGSFSNGADAFNFCLSHGRSSESQCIGRVISNSSADHRLQCYWPETGTPSSVCYEKPTS